MRCDGEGKIMCMWMWKKWENSTPPCPSTPWHQLTVETNPQNTARQNIDELLIFIISPSSVIVVGVEHLNGLNEQQKKAVLQKEGPLLIVAGAGAGKTKTVTHRILHLIKEGADPRSILAITFTNKAAKEMRDRVVKLLSEDKNLNFPASPFSPQIRN